MSARRLAAAIAAGAAGALMMTSTASAAPPVYTLTTTLNGAEVPGGGDPDGSGTATLVLDKAAHTVCYSISWANVDGAVTAAHVHEGAAGTTGGHIVDLFNGASYAGTDSASGCVRATWQIQYILNNPDLHYVNLHSSAYPSGALRGQLGD